MGILLTSSSTYSSTELPPSSGDFSLPAYLTATLFSPIIIPVHKGRARFRVDRGAAAVPDLPVAAVEAERKTKHSEEHDGSELAGEGRPVTLPRGSVSHFVRFSLASLPSNTMIRSKASQAHSADSEALELIFHY
jgi:hypothetical protein